MMSKYTSSYYYSSSILSLLLLFPFFSFFFFFSDQSYSHSFCLYVLHRSFFFIIFLVLSSRMHLRVTSERDSDFLERMGAGQTNFSGAFTTKLFEGGEGTCTKYIVHTSPLEWSFPFNSFLRHADKLLTLVMEKILCPVAFAL